MGGPSSFTERAHDMSVELNAYLFFPGNTDQAVAFYQQVFGGQVSITRRGEVARPTARHRGWLPATIHSAPPLSVRPAAHGRYAWPPAAAGAPGREAEGVRPRPARR